MPAGFPLTDASVGTSFAVVSGHDWEATDWSAFSKIPTLVVLMGGKALPHIAQQLMNNGWRHDTPVSSLSSTMYTMLFVAVFNGHTPFTLARHCPLQQLKPCSTMSLSTDTSLKVQTSMHSVMSNVNTTYM